MDNVLHLRNVIKENVVLFGDIAELDQDSVVINKYFFD
jgi:hypothetical protein